MAAPPKKAESPKVDITTNRFRETAAVPQVIIDKGKAAAGKKSNIAFSRGKTSAQGVFAEIDVALKSHRETLKPVLSLSFNQKLIALLPQLGVKSSEEGLQAIANEISQEAIGDTFAKLGTIQDPSQINQVLADSLTENILAHPQIGGTIKTSEDKIYQKAEEQLRSVSQQNQQALEQAAVLENISRIKNTSQQQLGSTINQQVEDALEENSPLATPSDRAQLAAALQAYYGEYLNELAQTPTGLDQIDQLDKLQEILSQAHLAAAQKIAAKTPEIAKINISNLANDLATDPDLNFAPPDPTKIEILGLGYAKPRWNSFTPGVGLSNYGYGLKLGTDSKFQQQTYLALLALDKDRLSRSIQKPLERLKELSQKKSLSFKENKERLKLIKKLEPYQQAQEFAAKDPKKFQSLTKFIGSLPQKQRVNLSSKAAYETTRAQFAASVFTPQSWRGQKSIPYFANRTWGSLAFNWNVFVMRFEPSAPLHYLNFRQVFFTFPQMGASGGTSAHFASFNNSVSQIRAARGLSSGIKAGRSLAGIGKTASTLAKVGTGPVGIGLAVASSPIGRRAAKAAAALAAYLLIKFGLNLLGAAAGLIFGAVTGLPLLLIPGFGLPLYAAWVAGWTLYGFANPVSMINLTINAVKFTGNAAGTIKGLFTGTGNATTTAATTLSSLGSSILGTFGNAAAAAWGGITSATGSAFGALSAGVSGFGSFVGSLSSAITGTSVAYAAAGGVATIGATGIVVGVVTATTFFSNEADLQNLPTGNNEFYTVTKTADKSHIENPPPNKDLTFTITLTAKALKLTNVQVLDQMQVQGKPPVSFTVTEDKDGEPISPIPCPTEIPAGGNCTYQIKISVDESYKDTTITNTVSVKATPEGQVEKDDGTTAVVTVGNPPTACFSFQGNWTDSEKATENDAIASLSRSPAYMSLLCSGGNVVLNRVSSSGYNWVECPNTINLSDLGVGSNNNNALYVLAHESGHIISCHGLQVYQDFLTQAPWQNEGFICSYPLDKTESEDFAESIAVYVVWKIHTFSGCPGPNINMPTQYPDHYNFDKNKLFGGFEY